MKPTYHDNWQCKHAVESKERGTQREKKKHYQSLKTKQHNTFNISYLV